MDKTRTHRSQDTHASSARRTLLRRIARDTAGNTLMLVAAATIPLVGMIGAGVDVSRTYLVKSRLQQACDAGVLAGRKYATNASFDTTARAKADAFFKNNFPTGAFGTSAITFVPTQNAQGEIVGVAKARVPMTVMTAFGTSGTDLEVKCDARLDIGNVDVALVLDVTGSMSASLGSGTRISELKKAVINFYDILGPGDPEKGRIRYAVVPYSTNVNVGYSIPAQYITGGTGPDSWAFQSRVAKMDVPTYASAAPVNLPNEVFNNGASISSADCSKYGNNVSFTGFTGGTNPTVTGGAPPAARTSIAYSNNATGGVDWGYSGAADTNGTSRSCRRKRVSTTQNFVGYGQNTTDRWDYRQTEIDITGYAAGDPVTIYTGGNLTASQTVPESREDYDMRELVETPGSTVPGTTVRWDGCIEEADTLDTITPTTPVSPLPVGAHDLNMDLIPNDDATRWKASWEEVVYYRSTAATSNSGTKEPNTRCPAEPARRLMEYTSIDSPPTGFASLSSFRTYINSLTISGGTMHDIGFIWGARFISGNGIFAADNPNSWNGEPVSRHIIFMTDGQMNAHNQQYVFHGWNDLDERVAPRGTSKSQMDAIHNRRLRIICEQAKSANITVWMIALQDPGSTDDFTDMQQCATSVDNHFKFVDSADDLNNEFRRIASNIADLRLTR